ncbi:hypothetical protein NDU88_006417 [Pleurodeles waltl]|uniref:Uncharacterized protein n=1 Tax=Pleurodeles waltl TaxID=8319 RepID=A0AAV7TX26_PLEWA|nr:hypothetical protein NDU88_006417 [Pleurodeles waltl]
MPLTAETTSVSLVRSSITQAKDVPHSVSCHTKPVVVARVFAARALPMELGRVTRALCRSTRGNQQGSLRQQYEAAPPTDPDSRPINPNVSAADAIDLCSQYKR